MSKANNFLSSTNFDFSGKIALVRIDSDVDLRQENGQLVVDEAFRLKQMLPSLEFLNQAGVKKIIMIGHLGRPAGQFKEKLSLALVSNWFSENHKQCKLISFNNRTIEQLNNFCLLQNLRFHPGERANDPEFAKKLAKLADVYINEAFGSSHRDHASITGIPKHLPAFLGLNFEAEIENLTKIKQDAKRPLVIVLGGSKKGKIDYIPFLADLADTLLIGGKLPLLIKDESIINHQSLIIAQLSPNNRDISSQSINKFKEIINQASTIFMVGPLGVYEEKENRTGTAEIAQTIAKRSISSDNKVFTLAAGGDTHRVLSWLDLWDKFNFVSTGGGAALQFLRDETLPGIEAVSNS